MAKSIIIELLLLIISLSIQKTKCNIFKKILNIFKAKKEENFLNIFIATHKDFQNYRYNPVYKIIANDPSQLKNKYNLEVIYCDLHNEIKDMDNAYAEMSRIYHIYNLYKNGKMSSKYIGFNHYRRYFPFLDNIPDLDEIFLNYDIIVGFMLDMNEKSLRDIYCYFHICKNYDEMINVIKDIKPEYYKTAIEVAKNNIIYGKNLFIMKKKILLIIANLCLMYYLNLIEDIILKLWMIFIIMLLIIMENLMKSKKEYKDIYRKDFQQFFIITISIIPELKF